MTIFTGETDDDIEQLIARLPKLATSKKKISVEEAEALIADDDELFSAVALYTARAPDIFEQDPAVLKKFIKLLKRIKPFRPRFGTFYRGEPTECRPHPRGLRSWSANKETAEDFARDYVEGVVCWQIGPVRGVSIEGIAMWRMRVREESHYAGMQAEWLLLDEGRS